MTNEELEDVKGTLAIDYAYCLSHPLECGEGIAERYELAIKCVEKQMIDNNSNWIYSRNNVGVYHLTCKNCNYQTSIYKTQEYKYCPNCGKKMTNGEWGTWSE